ncbi:FCD domain-containing protein, partial [Escherichia coli]|nr:FCD domain-containing protein [Escherichia coli]
YRRPARAGATAYGPERNVDDEHRQLLEAALSRDVERSVEMLAAHYRKTAQFIEHIISQEDRQAIHA